MRSQRIGLISDTHGHMDDRILSHLQQCDQIWHAGDIGNTSVLDACEAVTTTLSVYGNIDGREVQQRSENYLFFSINGMKILMFHYGGKVGRYDHRAIPLLDQYRPDIFVCGHSHILRVLRDKDRSGMLMLNPGAVGHHGFHKVRTMLRFTLAETPKDLEVIELGKRGRANQ